MWTFESHNDNTILVYKYDSFVGKMTLNTGYSDRSNPAYIEDDMHVHMWTLIVLPEHRTTMDGITDAMEEWTREECNKQHDCISTNVQITDPITLHSHGYDKTQVWAISIKVVVNENDFFQDED